LAEVHLLKLAVVLGVWQCRKPRWWARGWRTCRPWAALVPEWQVAQAMVLTTSWFIAGLSHCV